ncbi:MAG: InlB B-repeat-containing protein, partial [Coriobacteriales bacterium]|nr:InlB B-repeat-containing protein [Coriobacteriales bacterium]
KYNNLNTVYNMNGSPANYGLGSNDRYYVNGTAASYDLVSSLIRILQVPSLSVSTAIKNAWTNDQYVSSAIVPAKPGSDLYVRLSLTNSGNTDLDNIRLYDILPYDSDPLGSSGNMAFVSVTATRGTPQIYYANASNSLPTYGSHGSSGLDLQAASFWDSWSQANLADQTRAVLLDFGQSLTLEAGQTVQIELHFMIPAGDGLHGLNQFYYSAREADDYSVQINIVSPQHGFSTDVIALRYQANLPQLLVSAGSLANLPSDLVSLFNSDPAVDIGSGEKDALLVPSTVPTLAGYQFVGWNTAADGSGQNWSAGSVIQFTRPGGSVNLYAQWQGNLIYINYDLNDSAADPANPFTPLAGSTQAYFGGLIGQSYSPEGDLVDDEPGDVEKSSRGGEPSGGTGGIELQGGEPGGSGDPSDSTGGIELQGGEPDNGDDDQGASSRAGSSDDQSDDSQGDNSQGAIDPLSLNDANYELSLAQIVSLSISLLDDGNTVFRNPGNPIRSGYIFKGWYESVSLAEAYQPGTAWNFSTSVITNPWGYGSTKTLYAGWEKIAVDPPVTYVVSYYSNGSTLGSVPVDNDNPYVSGSLVTVLGRGTLARDDYRFMGWALSASGSVAYQPGARFTITANTAFYAVWQRVESPPIVVTGYSVTYLPGQHGNFAPQTIRGLLAGAATPAAPQVVAEAGWEFTGWSPERAATVSGNVIYVAQWSINAHTVTFVDWDGTVLKTERVLHGSNATAPAVPVRSGFVFTRWDNDFSSVTSDLTVQAIHYLDNISQEPREADDGTIVPGDSQVPLFGNNDYWALMNLALVVVGIGLALYAVIYKLPVRRRPGDDGLPSQATGGASGASRGAGGAAQGAAQGAVGGNARASREAYQSQTEPIQPAWLVTMVILAIAAAVLFILTEDLRKNIALVDFWTIVHALILLLEVIAMAFALRKTEPIDDSLAKA